MKCIFGQSHHLAISSSNQIKWDVSFDFVATDIEREVSRKYQNKRLLLSNNYALQVCILVESVILSSFDVGMVKKWNDDKQINNITSVHF